MNGSDALASVVFLKSMSHHLADLYEDEVISFEEYEMRIHSVAVVLDCIGKFSDARIAAYAILKDLPRE